MAILTFEVKGQTLTVKSSIGKIVENSIEYLDFEILTSKDWVCNSNDEKPAKALSKKLMITTKEGTFEFFPGSYITKNVIIAPGFEASVIGYEAEPGIAPRQITTNSVFVSVCPSGRIEKTGDPPNTRPNISNIDAIAGQVTELREELYGKEADGSIKEKTLEGSIESEIEKNQKGIETLNENLNSTKETLQKDYTSKINQLKTDLYGSSDKEKTLEGSIEDEIKQNKNDIQTLQGNTRENKKDIEQFYSEGIVPLDKLPLRDYKIVYAGDKWVASTDLGGYKHSLIKISPNLIGKKISVTSSGNVRSEIAFFTELPDYSTKPPYVEGTALKTDIVKFEDTIPSGTSWLYISRRKLDPNLEMAPVKLEIEGYDYCKGVTHNILEQKKLLNENIQSVQESLDTHINNKVENFEGNTDSNDKYPSVKAVYDFVNQSEHITKITEMNTYIWDLPSGIYTFAAIDKVQKIYFAVGVNQSCDEGAFLIVGGENYSGDLPSATTFKKSVIFLRNVKAAMAQIIAGISTVTYTIAEDGKVTYTAEWDGGIIESQDNKTNVIDESVTNNQYPSAKAVYSYGASIVEDFNSTIIEKTDEIKTEITDRSPALKNKKEDYKKLVISDVSNVEHNLSVLLHDGQGAPLANALLYCKGKNLFSLDDREESETSFHDKLNPPEGRNIFNGNRIFTGYAASNYYSPGRVKYNYTQETITLKSTHSSYGLAIDIEVTPKTSYCVSMKEKIEGFGFNVGFYDYNGKYLGLASSLDKKLVFTTPENTKWALVNLFPSEGYQDKTVTFSEVQLEEGQDRTFFEKYYPTQLTMSDINGKILSFKSNYPTTILESNNSQTKITCEYNQDINKAYDELQSNYEKLKTAIEKLGGTIE